MVGLKHSESRDCDWARCLFEAFGHVLVETKGVNKGSEHVRQSFLLDQFVRYLSRMAIPKGGNDDW